MGGCIGEETEDCYAILHRCLYVVRAIPSVADSRLFHVAGGNSVDL